MPVIKRIHASKLPGYDTVGKRLRRFWADKANNLIRYGAGKMDRKKMLIIFWADVAAQNDGKLKTYFTTDAFIRWNNTNEQFTVEEYIVANCEYPGKWCGKVERIELMGDLAVTVTRVWLSNNSVSFHVSSFFEFQGEKISALNEYWGDDGAAPQWRLEKHIGRPIN